MEELHESNPMLGDRGCRLGISYPEITEMQARAIFEAACEVAAEGVDVQPEVMIPLVGTKKELVHQAKVVRAAAAAVFAERGRQVKYTVGTMIEVPRGALVRRRDRGGGRVLLLRHERPHPDHLRHLAR